MGVCRGVVKKTCKERVKERGGFRVVRLLYVGYQALVRSAPPPCERIICVGEELELSTSLSGTSVRRVLCRM